MTKLKAAVGAIVLGSISSALNTMTETRKMVTLHLQQARELQEKTVTATR